MFSQVPVFADIGRQFWFPVTTQGTTDKITISTAFSTNSGTVELMPNQFFVFTAFRCWTNYDNYGMAVSTATVATPVVLRAFEPNNFNVMITQGGNSQFSQLPLSQAQIASSGYLAGKQLPIPSVYGPRETFRFDFTDTTGLKRLDGSNNPIALEIQMFMEGLIVQTKDWPKFLNLFPALKAAGF
jgi:hypothetical protein